MKRTILVLMALFLCLGSTGVAWAGFASLEDFVNYYEKYNMEVLGRSGIKVIEIKDGTFKLAPIAVSIDANTGGTILQTNITEINPSKTPEGQDVLFPNFSYVGYASIKLYSLADPSNPKEVFPMKGFPYTLQHFGSTTPGGPGCSLLGCIELPFGPWKLHFEQLNPGEYRLECTFLVFPQVPFLWVNLRGSQTFTVTQSPFDPTQLPRVSDVYVEPSGGSFILTIKGDNFGHNISSLSLKGSKGALLRKDITIISWTNKKIVCQVSKNPKARTYMRSSYRLFVSNGANKIKYRFRYP